MWNQNFNGVYRWIFTEVRKTCSQGALSVGADWKLQKFMLPWPLMREVDARQLNMYITVTCSVSIAEVLCTILRYIGPHNNGTRLYLADNKVSTSDD